MLQWILLCACFLIALGAWMKARSVGRRLEQLTQKYWDLRYQHGELRATVRRLDPEAVRDEVPEEAVAPVQSFIPLSSLKRQPGTEQS